MCFGLIGALLQESDTLTAPVVSEMTLWPIENPWIELAVGVACRSDLIGDGRHCSCGRVQRAPDGSLTLDGEAAEALASAADRGGQVAFFVHWFSGMFDTEELIPVRVERWTSYDLRSGSRRLDVDCLIWVSGK